MVHNTSIEEVRRREKEKNMMEEGIAMWKKQKMANQEKMLREKREVSTLKCKYLTKYAHMVRISDKSNNDKYSKFRIESIQWKIK